MFKYFPLIETITNYQGGYLKRDIIAALTVAVVALPQSMAYAVIAGVDPVYGLYSAIVLSILGAAFGNSNHLATGPTNAISLLIASAMGVYIGQPNFYQLLFVLTFLVGVMQLAMGVLRLGKLVNYVSHSVIVGFTAGAGVIIALGQLNQLLGISLPQGHFSTLGKVVLTVQHLSQTNYVALGLGLATVAITIALKKLNKNLPGSLLALVFCVATVMLFDLGRYGIKLTGDIPSAIPPFKMLDLNLDYITSLAGGAAVIAVIGLVEAVSISKAIASQTRQKLDSNQEFIGQGIANIGGAFFGSIAGSGSFTRSAITFQNGGMTRLTGVLAGAAVLVILIFLAPYAKYIPSAALAGVIMVVAYSMVDKQAVKKVLQSNRNDAAVLGVTFLATVLAPELEYAIYSGVLISLLLFLRNTGTAGVSLLEAAGTERCSFIESPGGSDSAVTTVQLEGNLYFASSADLDEKLNNFYSAGSMVIIIRFKHVYYMDITALEVIENFIQRALADGKKIMLSGVRQEILPLLESAHILSLVGKENVFPAEKEVFGSLAKSVSAAYEYVKTAPGQVLHLDQAATSPSPSLSGSREKRSLIAAFGALVKMFEDPFLEAELHKVDILLKKV